MFVLLFGVTMKKLHFIFRLLSENDLPLLTARLNRPHLQKWWRAGKINLEEVRNKYLPRIFEENTAKPFLAFLGNNPIVTYNTI